MTLFKLSRINPSSPTTHKLETIHNLKFLIYIFILKFLYRSRDTFQPDYRIRQE